MKRFFKGLLAFILIAIIIGGTGYIGYSYFFMNNGSMGMNMDMSMYSNEITATTNNASNGTDSMQGGMSHGSMNMQGQQGSTMDMQNQQGNTMIVDTVKDILSNKQNLDDAIATFNDALASLTLDPYSPSEESNTANVSTSHTDNMGGMQMSPDMVMPETAVPADTTTPVDAQANNSATTVNIYPENNNTASMQSVNAVNMTKMDMGTSYDPNKMEQLHRGLYKLSSAMQMLEQLNNKLLTQAEAGRNANTQNPTEYYSSQYTQILENKNKLNKALNNIREASNLVNINPYISDNGIVYDKARMLGVHDSIFKMAKGVALLDLLNDELVKQAINASVDVQNAINNNNMSAMTNHNYQGNVGMTTGILGNINISSMFSIVLIASVVLFVLGLIGAISSLFKTPQKNTN